MISYTLLIDKGDNPTKKGGVFMRVHLPENGGMTMIENTFIDQFMPTSSGDFVKIYLYLMRCAQSGQTDVSVSQIADALNYTESDVKRAMGYWQKRNCLELIEDTDKETPISSAQSSYAHSASMQTPYAQASYMQTPYAQTSSVQTPFAQNASVQAPFAQNVSAQTPFAQNASGQPAFAQNASVQAPFVQNPSGQTAFAQNASVQAPFAQNVSAQAPFAQNASAQTPFAQNSSMQSSSVQASSVQSGSSKITEFRPVSKHSKEDIRSMLFVAENYFGRPLSQNEQETLIYFLNDLGMSIDLIDYLLDYCISTNHTSFWYIKKVAMNWAEHGIRSVEQARRDGSSYRKEYFTIFHSLGIRDHVPTPAEQEYMDRWLEEYALPMDLILLACERTILQIGKAQFSYTESIVKNWHDNNVHTIKDIEALDKEHEQSSRKIQTAGSHGAGHSSTGRFLNYESSGTDWDAVADSALKAQEEQERISQES